LSKTGFHVGGRLDSRGGSLRGLSPADLRAVGGYEQIQQHILRFERRYRYALAGSEPAQASHYGALARIRSGAGHRQRPSHEGTLAAPMFEPVQGGTGMDV
jgi:hypothetical protein